MSQGFSKPTFDKITNDIIFIKDLNPYSIFWSTNSVIIRKKDQNFIVDAGFNPLIGRYLHELAKKEFGDFKTHLIITHHHLDHSFGMNYFIKHGMGTITSSRFRECIKDNGEYYIQKALDSFNIQNVDYPSNVFSDVFLEKPTISVTDTMEIGPPKNTLIIFPTPGHTIDSIAIFDPKSKILITGDSLMPQPKGTIPMPQIPLDIHLNSFDIIEEFEVKTLLQGHGDVQSGDFISTMRRQAINLYGKI